MVTVRRSSNQFTGIIVSGSLGFSKFMDSFLNKIERITSVLEPLLNRLQVSKYDISPACIILKRSDVTKWSRKAYS